MLGKALATKAADASQFACAEAGPPEALRQAQPPSGRSRAQRQLPRVLRENLPRRGLPAWLAFYLSQLPPRLKTISASSGSFTTSTTESPLDEGIARPLERRVETACRLCRIAT